MLDFGLIDYLNIDFSDLFEDYVDEDIDINEIIFADRTKNMFACAHLSSLTGGFFCKKAEESNSIEEVDNYYQEAIDLIHSDFEWSDHKIGMYKQENNDINLQILKKSYNYCLDSISASVNRRLNRSAEENKSKKKLLEIIEEMRTKINSTFEK